MAVFQLEIFTGENSKAMPRDAHPIYPPTGQSFTHPYSRREPHGSHAPRPPQHRRSNTTQAEHHNKGGAPSLRPGAGKD